VSPVVQERQNDKAELQRLNGRLDNYVASVRNLEREKNELKVRLDEIKGNADPQASKMFETKISELQKEIEALTKEKAQLRVDLAKKDSDKGDVDVKLVSLARQVDDAERQAIALEQKIPHLEEQLKFRNQVHDDEVKAVKAKTAEKDKEINQLRNHVKEELAKALAKEKKEWDEAFQDEKKFIAGGQKEATDKLEKDLGQATTDNANFKVEITGAKNEIKGLNDKLGEHRKENQKVVDDLHKAQDQANRDVARLQSQIAEKTADLLRTKAETAAKRQEVLVLSTENISLKGEISVYTKLLAAEENRLGLAKAETPVKYAAEGAEGSKRRRLEDSPAPIPKSPSVETPQHGPGIETGWGEVSPSTAPLKIVPKISGKVIIDNINVESRSFKLSNMTSVSLFLLFFLLLFPFLYSFFFFLFSFSLLFSPGGHQARWLVDPG